MSESKRTDWRRAVAEVLGRHEGAMSSESIVAELQAAGNCPWKGKTPEASASANIYLHIKNEGEQSLFDRPVRRKALFTLSARGRKYFEELQCDNDGTIGRPEPSAVHTETVKKAPAKELPKYNEFYGAILSILSDGKIRIFSDLCNRVATLFNIPDELRKLVSDKSKTNIFIGRVNWACVYLVRAGLIERTKRAYYKISKEGEKVNSLMPKLELTNAYLADNYPSFAQFIGHSPETHERQDESGTVASSQKPVVAAGSEAEETPHDAIESAYKKINTALADEILDTILSKNDPAFFERLVTQLLESMGYGGAICSNGKTGDEGIDAIIKEDKLGFSKIYIQAKCWARDKTVSRPDVQAFVGALAGQGADKGAFITTASFSKQARDFVAKQHNSKVVLIDGELLANLMIEHDFGVSTQSTYVIKHLDSDFFNEEA